MGRINAEYKVGNRDRVVLVWLVCQDAKISIPYRRAGFSDSIHDGQDRQKEYIHGLIDELDCVRSA